MILEIIDGVVLIAAGAVCIPLLTLSIECFAALWPARRSRVALPDAGRLAVIVPAHDEETGIAATLRSITTQLSATDQLWVVADNCNDQTAAIARRCGAHVLSRVDPVHRGKGYALGFALQHIAENPPDVVIFVDADCHVEQGAIRELAAAARSGGRPVQSVYLMRSPPETTPRGLVSESAVAVKNFVRPLGLARLGLPCFLTGSGMAFPWSIVRDVQLAADSIVEDMQWSVDLLLAGHRPQLCERARVTAMLPSQSDVAVRQRRRWEHGHLHVVLTQVPRLLAGAVRQRRLDLFAAALEAGVPPLSLLGLIWLASLCLATTIGLAWSFWLPAASLAIVGLIAVSAVASALARLAPGGISWASLGAVALYVGQKIPLYASFFWNRETAWVRTSRGLPPEPKMLKAPRMSTDAPLPVGIVEFESHDSEAFKGEVPAWNESAPS